MRAGNITMCGIDMEKPALQGGLAVLLHTWDIGNAKMINKKTRYSQTAPGFFCKHVICYCKRVQFTVGKPPPILPVKSSAPATTASGAV